MSKTGVGLTTQSWYGCGGLFGVVMGEPIMASHTVSKSEPDAREKAFGGVNAKLREKAGSNGYCWVLDIIYQFDKGADGDIWCIAIGTGYRPKKGR